MGEDRRGGGRKEEEQRKIYSSIKTIKDKFKKIYICFLLPRPMLRVRFKFLPELSPNPIETTRILSKTIPKRKSELVNISMEIWSLKLYTQSSSPALLFPSSDLQNKRKNEGFCPRLPPKEVRKFQQDGKSLPRPLQDQSLLLCNSPVTWGCLRATA